MSLTEHTVSSIVETAAMELVQRHDLDEIEQVLVGAGVPSGVAAKAVLLIPSAFAAVHYELEGIECPAEFLVGPPEAERVLSYTDEPLYQEAKRLAARWIAEGRLSLVARVLDWSAEASGIEEARSQGLHPTRMSSVHHGEWWD